MWRDGPSRNDDKERPIRIHVIDISVKQDCHPDFERDFGPEHHTRYINAFSDAYPDPAADGLVVLTGSAHSITRDYPWLPGLEAFTRARCQRGLPLFGVCYGHQLIARALAGRSAVGRAAAPEIGFGPVEIVKPHPVFAGLPDPFRVMSSHYDEVRALPDGFEVLARSRHCAIQAMAHRQAPIVGVQFHAEFDAPAARRSVEDERDKLLRLGLDPDALLAGIPERRAGAEAILRNMAALAGAGRARQ